MNALLDTSALIARPRQAADIIASISSASLAELHFGVLVAKTDEARRERLGLLARIESTFDPLVIDRNVARVWGAMAARVTHSGGQPRRRAIDLAIAATAAVHGLVLITHNAADFAMVDDLVEVVAA